jgi:predicted RNA-binding Zn ribbon-like protein
VPQRPLVGEPLALDLVNTWWIDRGQPCDLFDEPGGVESWLREHGLLDPEQAGVTVSAVEPALREARAALRGAVERADDAADTVLNTVLARGVVRRRVRGGVVTDQVDVPDHWRPAWCAAASYLDLLRDRPERIRRCAHPACVLYFYDISRNGTRRWCSMDGCGSRVKASRHYSRVRARAAGPS